MIRTDKLITFLQDAQKKNGVPMYVCVSIGGDLPSLSNPAVVYDEGQTCEDVVALSIDPDDSTFLDVLSEARTFISDHESDVTAPTEQERLDILLTRIDKILSAHAE